MELFDSALLASVMRAVIPILLAALGGLICERAGVFNISLEGLMLIGAFAGVVGSFFSGNAVMGVLAAVVGGVLMSCILAYGSINRGGDPIVLGVAINLFAVGITGFMLTAIWGVRGVFQDPGIVGIDKAPVPLLADIPWIGPSLFNLSFIGYLALLLVPITTIVLFRTPLGLRLRGVGERPLAASSLGVRSAQYQWGAVLISGALCGLAGAQLALGNVVQFAENMTAGRGWIAVVAVMLARANPWGALGAALLFGLAEAVGFRLQGNGLPSQLTDAAPYVVTLIALVLARRAFMRTSTSSAV
ncbi:MAG: ABC transporter permease [Microbacteriaceae bacterium]